MSYEVKCIFIDRVIFYPENVYIEEWDRTAQQPYAPIKLQKPLPGPPAAETRKIREKSEFHNASDVILRSKSSDKVASLVYVKPRF